jgi:hypothetical protein
VGIPLAAEHYTPAGIAALFYGFGDMLEVDPTCFLGLDLLLGVVLRVLGVVFCVLGDVL